jgi:aspartate aminotransferase
MVMEFEKRRNVIVEKLNAIPGITCMIPQGAFYVFPSIAGLRGRKYGGRSLLTSADLAGYLLDEANVAVIPGGEFGHDDHIRLSYATSMAKIEEGLHRIREAIMKLE